jgi:hypothetical protein
MVTESSGNDSTSFCSSDFSSAAFALALTFVLVALDFALVAAFTVLFPFALDVVFAVALLLARVGFVFVVAVTVAVLILLERLLVGFVRVEPVADLDLGLLEVDDFARLLVVALVLVFLAAGALVFVFATKNPLFAIKWYPFVSVNIHQQGRSIGRSLGLPL